jgi:tripartite-type tricarboxylate transporter receptor subunit TctC
MKKILAICLSSTMLLGFSASVNAADKFPARPLTIIVPAGAGGGGDTTTRILAREIEEKLGQPVTIINQGQGGGVVGLTSIANANPDGYTVGLLYPYAGYKFTGQADFKLTDFTPIGNFNGDAAAIMTRADNKINSPKELLEALKANPAGYKIHCGHSCGGVWDTPVAGMMLDYGIDVGKINWIPGQGSAAGMTELTSRGVDFLTASLPEASSLIQSGHVKAVAVLSPTPVPGFENVPLAGDAVGRPVDAGSWRAIGGPANLPPEIVSVWEEVIHYATQQPRYIEAMNKGKFAIRWLDHEALTNLMKQHESDTAKVMEALGYGKK